jgi:hypothetical protein
LVLVFEGKKKKFGVQWNLSYTDRTGPALVRISEMSVYVKHLVLR